MNTPQTTQSGFTLIELVAVIVLLGVLAVTALPRFIDLKSDAEVAVLESTAGAMRTGIQLAHAKWRALGSPTGFAARNDVRLFGAGTTGQIDFNSNGWPAQSYPGPDTILHTNNVADCMSVWRTMMEQSSGVLVATDTSADYQAVYLGGEACNYLYTDQPAFAIRYDSTSGQISVDTTP